MTENRNPNEEWVRERLVARLFEPLPPDEEAQVEAYLKEHPDLHLCEKQYKEIANAMSNPNEATEEISAEEVETFVSAYQNQIAHIKQSQRSRVLRWLAGAAIAASFLGLVLVKGITIQVGETRIAFGQTSEISEQEEDLFREQLREELAALSERTLFQNQQIEAIYQLVSYQRAIDREETRNTIQRLAQIASKSGYQGTPNLYNETSGSVN